MKSIAVYGAYGHTGRFVVDRLVQKGWSPILCGRDKTKLDQLQRAYPHLHISAVSINDRSALKSAFRDHHYSQAFKGF